MKKRSLTFVVLISGLLFAQRSNAQWTGTNPGPIYYNGGNVGIGTTNPGFKLTVQGTIMNSESGNYANIASSSYSDVAWHGSRIGFTRYRGVFATPTAVVNGDYAGWFDFFGHDGANTQRVGQFVMQVDGTVSSGIVPGKFVISTANTSGVNITRFTAFANDNITMATNGGNVGIGVVSPTAKLHVGGSMVASNFSNATTGLNVGPYTGNTTGTSATNITIGSGVGNSLTSGGGNNIIGINTAQALTTGYRNMIIGGLSTSWNATTAQSLTTGFDNVLIGAASGTYITTGAYNVGVGSGTLLSGGTSNYNTAVGYTAGFYNTGTNNTFLGYNSGGANTSGINNVTIGSQAGRSNTTGSGLTFVGASAGWTGTTDGLSNATAIGYNAQVASSNSLVLGNGVNVGIGTTTPTEMLTLGKTGGSKGLISFFGNTSGKVILQPAAAAGTWTMTLPTSAGTNGYILQTDGTGNTSWTPAPSGNAGTLSGTSLSPTVTASSLTSVGTIGTGVWQGSTIGPAFGGTGANAAFTQGSLVFAGTAGVYSQDNANLHWNAANQQLLVGTTAAPAGYKLAVKGNVIAESVKVQLHGQWADYVFDKDYKLMPLHEVQNFIGKNHHLPEIPSAQEVKEQGLDLGSMNQLLTKKVEELTLYIINQDKSIKEQADKLDSQAKDLAELKKQLAILLKKQ